MKGNISKNSKIIYKTTTKYKIKSTILVSHVLFVHLLPVSFAEKLLKLLKLGRASALAGLSGGCHDGPSELEN